MNDPQLPAHEVAARAAHEAAARRAIRMNLEACGDDAVAEGLARALVELFEAEIEALAAPDHPVAPPESGTR